MMQKVVFALLFAPVALGFVSPITPTTVSKTAVFAADEESQNKGGFFGGVKNFFEELDAFGESM